MEIEELIKKIIPQSDYQHREGFNNRPIIDELPENEKRIVEDELIRLLLNDLGEQTDPLIVETLAYLKSEKSLPVLKSLLNDQVNNITKLTIASSIFEISRDSEMVAIAISTFKKISQRKDQYYTNGLIEAFFSTFKNISQRKDQYYIYDLIAAFYYLAKFKNPEINKILERYTNHKEYLVSYNAKRYLDLFK
jgi:hypothetical protein